MDILFIVLRWIHILSAITLLGGSIFLRFALIPSLKAISQEVRDPFQEAIRRRWAVFVMAASGLLLVSGIINIGLISMRYDFSSGYYHGLFGIKFLIALVIFYTSSLLAGRSDTAQRFRQRMPFWLNVNLTLAVILICISGVMRFAQRTPKSDEKPSQSSQTAPIYPTTGENT